jgi:FAD/FMN-containing dehydrogenase
MRCGAADRTVAAMTTTTTSQLSLDELRFRLGGNVFEAGDAGYADACTLFNAAIDYRPRLVARCSAPDDVIAAISYARAHGLETAVRGGGHSVTGRSLCDDGLVIDMRGMSDVEVDAERRVARVGGGATWADVDRATQAHGLATTGGRVSTTGVAGLTLGGGSGWLERKHGLACDNLIAAQLVTADGQLVRASEDEHPELLWALRGGGGNFGVVTSLELALHPIEDEILAGLVLHPAERGAELLRLFRDISLAAPDALGLAFAYITAPAEPEIPAELHGQPAVIVAGMFAGPVAEGEQVLRDLRAFGPPAADFFEPTTYADFQCSLDDPPGYRNYWTAEHLGDLSDEAIDAIARRAQDLPAGASQIFIVPWGGQVARCEPGSSPLAGRDSAFIVHPLLLWEDQADDERLIEFGRACRDELRPFATGATYLNFLGDEGQERVRSGFGAANYERLAQVKATWDPTNVFHGNQNVAPALQLPYVEQGDPDGIPVLMLHGYSDSWRSFEHVMAHLPDDLRAIAVTQRGHGDAQRPAAGYTPREFADDAIATLDALGIERVVIVGHSMGSWIAERIAVDHPDRVLGVVLAGAVGQVGGNPDVAELVEAAQTFTDPVGEEFCREFQLSTLEQPLPEGQLDVSSPRA